MKGIKALKKGTKTKAPAKAAAKRVTTKTATKTAAKAKAPAAKKAAVKPAAKKPAAKSAPAKKAAAPKAAAKKALAKPVAKKQPAKKAPVKKEAVKAVKKPVAKTPAKKVPAKKAAVKKPAAKKPDVKKVVVKKPLEKKPEAKKLDAKKGVVKTAPAKPAAKPVKAAPAAKAKPEPVNTPKLNRTAPLKAPVKAPVKEATPAPVIIPRKKVATTNVTILPPDYDLKKDKGDFMNPVMAEYFRQKLIRWREELLRESTETIQVTLQGTELQKPDLADRASAETDHALELRTRDRERKLISKINEALLRIEDGTYGYCEETGEPIAVARLDARPTATLSIEAQERHERLERTHRDE